MGIVLQLDVDGQAEVVARPPSGRDSSLTSRPSALTSTG